MYCTCTSHSIATILMILTNLLFYAILSTLLYLHLFNFRATKRLLNKMISIFFFSLLKATAS